jgi:hypothetical protein
MISNMLLHLNYTYICWTQMFSLRLCFEVVSDEPMTAASLLLAAECTEFCPWAIIIPLVVYGVCVLVVPLGIYGSLEFPLRWIL